MSMMENRDMQQDLPLSGVRVIDFTQVMMGPVCTQTLGDYGADVIKIERKGAGDLSRSTFEPVAGADNPIFCSLNRNKRSVALDLRDPAHMAQVKALIAGADVVVNNFRAGVMERMGLGYDDCKALNPRVIYAVGTGYGETGPYAFKGGQDVLAQAISGVMARRSDASVPVSVYPTALADYSAGMHMVQGILLALLHRARTGQGQKISVSLYNSMLAMQMQEAAMILMADSEVNWAAMPLCGVYDTRTGPLVMVGAFKPNPLRDICAALEIDDLSADPRYCDLTQQFKNKAALQAIFRERYAGNTREHWLARLEAVDIPCSPVRDLREALVDPQTLHNQMLIEGDGEGQRVRFINSPITMSSAQVSLRRAPPRLGQHNEDVLRELAQAADTPRRRHERASANREPCRHGDAGAARRAQRRRPRHRGRAATHLDRDRGPRRRPRGRAHRRRRARLLRGRGPEEPHHHRAGILGRGAARRLRRHRAARDPERAGRGPRQRFRAGRRLRDGAGLRHRGGLRGSQLRPAGGAGGPHAAGRRHDAAAAADSLPQGDGDAADGSPNPAREAAELGLINEVVPRAGLDEAVQRWVDALLACAPLSQQAIKQVVRRTGTLSPADAQALRLPALVAAPQSEDAHEGVLAFQQKRKPQWRGR